MLLLSFLACTPGDVDTHLVTRPGRSASDPVEPLGDASPPPPDADVLWDTATLPVFALTFPTDDWAAALTAALPPNDCDDRPYLTADLTFTNPATGGEEHWPDVGVRYRGHSALDVPNYSNNNRWGLKLDFSALVPSRAFHGVERLNLLGTEGDPSLLRERVAFEVMAASGVPAPAANHAWVIVNGEPLGLFPLVEEPDDTRFLAAHFPTADGSRPDGHLYKVGGYCHGTNLDYEGDNVAAYDGFEPKAGTVDADKSTDVIPMLRCLVGESDEALRSCLSGAIDTDEFLTEIATDMYIRNVDGMAATGQNFLLYTPLGGPTVVYPYDLDLTWYRDDQDILRDGIFDLRPIWELSPPVLPSVVRAVWKDDYCARVLEVAAAQGDALTTRIRTLEDALDGPMGDDPFLSRSNWEDAVDDLVREVESRHDDVVRDATQCEIPAPPPDPEPTDTGAPADTAAGP